MESGAACCCMRYKNHQGRSCSVCSKSNETRSSKMETLSRRRGNGGGGASKSVAGWSGWEAYCAVKDNNISLLKKGNEENKLDPNATFRGGTILSTAILLNRPELVRLLLHMGADPDLKSEQNGRKETPLITAVRMGNIPIVETLLASGAALEATNFYGQDVIYQAVEGNATEILQLILNKIVESPPPSRHPVLTQCPLYLALTHCVSYRSKRQSLFLLLRSHFHGDCLSAFLTDTKVEVSETWRSLPSSNNSHNPAFSNKSNSCFLGQSVISNIDQDIFRWIFLSHGILLVHHPSTGRKATNFTKDSRETSDDFCRKENVFSRIRLSFTPRNHLARPPIKLCYLSRIVIRKIANGAAQRNKTNFITIISSLPLPLGLIKFLLLSDILPLL